MIGFVTRINDAIVPLQKAFCHVKIEFEYSFLCVSPFKINYQRYSIFLAPSSEMFQQIQGQDLHIHDMAQSSSRTSVIA